MKPLYLQAETPGRDRWMVSYLDVLTILLIFFVAIAAHALPVLSQVSVSAPAPPPPPEVKAAPAPPHPDVIPPPAEEPRADLIQIEKTLEEDGLDLRLEPRGLVVSLPQAVLFASGEDRVSREALPIVKQIADAVRDAPNKLILVGHADSMPIHNRRFRNNWELSAARGLSLLDLLSSDYGVPEDRLSVSSEGSNSPQAPNDTPNGRASNRRVEIVIQDQ